MYPLLTEFFNDVQVDNFNKEVSSKFLDEAESFLLDIFSYCTYELEQVQPAADGWSFTMPAIYKSALSNIFEESPLEVFLASELLMQYRQESWVLPVALTVDIPVGFTSYFPAWRRIVADYVFENGSEEAISTLGSTLPLNTLKGLFLRHQNNKAKVTMLSEFVRNRASDDQTCPSELLEDMESSLLA